MLLAGVLGFAVTGCSYLDVNTIYNCFSTHQKEQLNIPTAKVSAAAAEVLNCKYRSSDNCFELSNKFSIIDGSKQRVWYIRPTNNLGCSYYLGDPAYTFTSSSSSSSSSNSSSNSSNSISSCCFASSGDDNANCSGGDNVDERSCDNYANNQSLFSDNYPYYFATVELSKNPLLMKEWKRFGGNTNKGSSSNSSYDGWEKSMKLAYYLESALSNYQLQYDYLSSNSDLKYLLSNSNSFSAFSIISTLPPHIAYSIFHTTNFVYSYSSMSTCQAFITDARNNISSAQNESSEVAAIKAYTFLLNSISLYCKSKMSNLNIDKSYMESLEDDTDKLIFRTSLDVLQSKDQIVSLEKSKVYFKLPLSFSQCHSDIISFNINSNRYSISDVTSAMNNCNMFAKGNLAAIYSMLVDLKPIDSLGAVLQVLRNYTWIFHSSERTSTSFDPSSSSGRSSYSSDLYDSLIESYCDRLIIDKDLYFNSKVITKNQSLSILNSCEDLLSYRNGGHITLGVQRNKLFAFGMLIFNHLCAFGRLDISISSRETARHYLEGVEAVHFLLKSVINTIGAGAGAGAKASTTVKGDFVDIANLLNFIPFVNFIDERIEFLNEVMEVIKSNLQSQINNFIESSQDVPGNFTVRLADDVLLFLANKFSGSGQFDTSLILFEILLKTNSDGRIMSIFPTNLNINSDLDDSVHDIRRNSNSVEQALLFEQFYECFDNYLGSSLSSLSTKDCSIGLKNLIVSSSSSSNLSDPNSYHDQSYSQPSFRSPPMAVTALSFILNRKYLSKILANSHILKFYISIVFSINAPLVISETTYIGNYSMPFCGANLISRWSTFATIHAITRTCESIKLKQRVGVGGGSGGEGSVKEEDAEGGAFCYLDDPMYDFNSKGLFLLAYQGYSLCDSLYSSMISKVHHDDDDDDTSDGVTSALDKSLQLFQYFGDTNLQFDYILPQKFNEMMFVFMSNKHEYIQLLHNNNKNNFKNIVIPIDSKTRKNDEQSRKRIRIAFISSYFSNHSVGKLLGNLLKRLLFMQSMENSPNQHHDYFIVEIMSSGPGSSSDERGGGGGGGRRNLVKESLQRIVPASHWIQTPAPKQSFGKESGGGSRSRSSSNDNNDYRQSGNSGSQVVADIRALDLDIAVFGDVYMDTLTTFVSQFRIAKYGIVFWGHPFTSIPSSSVNNIDYFISSTGFELSSAKQDRSAQFHEQLVLFDSLTFLMYEQEENDLEIDATTAATAIAAVDVSYNSVRDQAIEASNQRAFWKSLVEEAAKERLSFLEKLFSSAYMINDVSFKTYYGVNQFSKWFNDINGRNRNNMSTVKIVSLLQTTMKMHPLLDKAIVDLLMRDELVLIMISRSPKYFQWQARFQARLSNLCNDLGINSVCFERIAFVNQGPHETYTSFLCNSDVSLDPIVFGGGVTLVDGLSQCSNPSSKPASSSLSTDATEYTTNEIVSALTDGDDKNFLDWYSTFEALSSVCWPVTSAESRVKNNFHCNPVAILALKRKLTRLVPFSTCGDLQSVHKLGLGIANHLFKVTGSDLFRITQDNHSEASDKSKKSSKRIEIHATVRNRLRSFVDDTIRIAGQSYYHKLAVVRQEDVDDDNYGASEIFDVNKGSNLFLNDVIRRDLFGRFSADKTDYKVVDEWIHFFDKLDASGEKMAA